MPELRSGSTKTNPVTIQCLLFLCEELYYLSAIAQLDLNYCCLKYTFQSQVHNGLMNSQFISTL